MGTLKVYLKTPNVYSPSLKRVERALIKYKPDNVDIVENKYDADLVILHVIGRQDQAIKEAKHLIKYAVIQYAVRSTLRPDTKGWMKLWENARLVWSYYNLPELCYEDRIIPDFRFYYSPLGVENTFKKILVDKKFLIATSGQSYLTESVRECIVAAEDRLVFHLGKKVDKENVVSATGISDRKLSEYYSQCQFVSGLRRVEGFELPAAEGIICGARPIMFDRPHYREWFKGLAVFIPEEDREKTIKNLKKAYGRYRPVSDEEIEVAKQRFNWEKIITGFWNRVL